jgi:hypothetical protein
VAVSLELAVWAAVKDIPKFPLLLLNPKRRISMAEPSAKAVLEAAAVLLMT